MGKKKRKTLLPRIRFESKASPYRATRTYYFILVPALLLGAFGLMMGFSATSVSYIGKGVSPYQPFLRTLLIAGVALGLGTTSAFIKPRIWDRLAFLIYAFALTLQFSVLVIGIEEGGNVNWIPLFGTGIAFQPSELLKLATALVLGRVLSSPALNIRDWKQVLTWAGIPSLLSLVAVMAGGDQGTMLIFVALIFGALWMAGIPGLWLGYLGLAGAGVSAFLLTLSSSRLRRVYEFLSGQTSNTSVSAPTQTDHGLWALGSGGLFGLGPGASREKWDYLQEAHTDFILAIIGEEFGLVGTLTLLVVTGALIYGVFSLSSHSPNPFIRVTAGAMGAWLSAQTFINVGTVIGLVPVIGVPFPLVSYGGSSFLFTAIAIGVLLSFARADVANYAGQGTANANAVRG